MQKERQTNLEEAVRAYEKQLIEETLRCSRTCREAAEKLGISPQKLNYRMKILKIHPEKE